MSSELPDGWSISTMSALCDRVTSGGTPSRKLENLYYANEGIPWVKTKELRDGWIAETEECITELGLAKSSAKLLPPDTVLVAMYGATVGMLGMLRRPAACNQACAALIADREVSDPHFLFYALLAHRSRLIASAVGSAQQNISGALVKAFSIPAPPLDEQRRIAAVLRGLDDKIASNDDVAACLMRVASSAFDQLLLDSCESITLGELGEIRGGGTPKSSEPDYWSPDEVAWITPKDMTALGGAPVVWRGERSISRLGLEKSSAKLFPVGTVLYTSRATLGMLAVAQQKLSTNQGFIAVEPRAGLSSEFVYFTLAAQRERIAALANGSTFLEVNKSNFKSVSCKLPSEERRREFDALAKPAFQLIATLTEESRHLRAIRDDLLPKLVSGKIRVPEAAEIAEAGDEAALEAARA